MEECNVVRMEGKKVNAVNIKRSKDNASGMVVHTDNNSAAYSQNFWQPNHCHTEINYSLEHSIIACVEKFWLPNVVEHECKIEQ